MLTSLLDYGPSVEPVYDSRSTALIVMIIIICFLIAAIIMLIVFCLNSKNKNATNTEQQTNVNTQEEQTIINSYRRLKESDKNVIKQMLNSLDNNSDKE